MKKQNTTQSNYTAAIYDCSYFIHIENTFFRHRKLLWLELRRIFTQGTTTVITLQNLSERRGYTVTSYGYSETPSYGYSETPLMSDLEFKSIRKEIYEFALLDSGTNIEIINFREHNEPDDGILENPNTLHPIFHVNLPTDSELQRKNKTEKQSNE